MASASEATAPAPASSSSAAPSGSNTVRRPKAPGFVDSFWSADYAAGLGQLFAKLQQGVVENQQVLTIATLRAEAEEYYSERLGDIAPTIDRLQGGFARDDGASVRKAYEGVRVEMIEATKNHMKIADNIRELVVVPFGRWCDAHAQRIQNSQDDLQSKIKTHDRQAEQVKKLRTAYYNKCRLLEDQQEEEKLAFQDPEKDSSPKANTHPDTPPTIVVQEDVGQEPVELGDRTYTPEQLQKIMAHMLENIPMGETKVPILGVYQNVSSGADVTSYIQTHLGASNIEYAEQVGQDLVIRGFLRLIGTVGNTFANSSRMKYQWKQKAWVAAGIPERKKALGRVSTMTSIDALPESPVIANFTETLQTWNPLNNPYPNETPAERLKREAREADDKYKGGVKRLDLMRCNLEESMMDHLKFLERCETDRLKAIKSVILDFSGTISNSIPSFQSQVDHMMLYQETIQPLGDLRYLLENYRTGPFIPKVTTYENYYGSVEDETFGVDLEARARADKKRVPIIVTSILTYLDNHYPDLEGDEARRGIWLTDVPLAATHHLRNTINNGKPVQREVLEKYEIPIVASALKLYLLELPESLVSSSAYEIIKTIYNSTPDAKPSGDDESQELAPRIKALQSTLGTLRLQNIATLDGLMTHFTRLIDLTSADEAYISQLAQTLAPCVLRARAENSLTLEERHSYRLVRDLFQHKEVIFGELKRQSSLSASNSLSNRQRAVSSADERQRRAAMEARARAINQERQRAKSPGPANRHRRDKSTDGSLGRFPVVASPRADHGRNGSGGASKRMSLTVPDSATSSPSTTRHEEPNALSHNRDSLQSHPEHGATDREIMPGAFSGGGPGPHIPPPLEDDEPAPAKSLTGSLKRQSGVTRRNLSSGTGSMKRNGGLSGVEEKGQAAVGENRGVPLNDKPMDDDFR